jgi:hypothetical protein
MKSHWFTLIDLGLFNNAKEHNKRHLDLNTTKQPWRILTCQEFSNNTKSMVKGALVWENLM